MSIFTILTYAVLTLVVVSGTASLFSELGARGYRSERPLLPLMRRVLRHRA